jgi:hypothetical protein
MSSNIAVSSVLYHVERRDSVMLPLKKGRESQYVVKFSQPGSKLYLEEEKKFRRGPMSAPSGPKAARATRSISSLCSSFVHAIFVRKI